MLRQKIPQHSVSFSMGRCLLAVVCGLLLVHAQARATDAPPSTWTAGRQLLQVSWGGGEDHGDGHSTEGWEWAGAFDTPEDNYVWVAQGTVPMINGMEYEFETMKIVVLNLSDTLENLKSKAVGMITGDDKCTVLEAGGDAVQPDQCFKLKFNADLHTSYFPINLTSVEKVAIFAEHHPVEFERDQHYLHDMDGEDVEPVSEMSPEEDSDTDGESKPWGSAIGAAIFVNVVTLIGVIFLAPPVMRQAKEHPAVLGALTNSFAAGALLACAFYLMLYEATHLIVRDTEAEASAMWGCMILVGFLLACVVDLFAASLKHYAGVIERNKCDACEPSCECPCDDTVKDVEMVADQVKDVQVVDEHTQPALAIANHRVRVLSGILVGDFVHNFVDGIFIGTGFIGCGNEMGWTITAATVFHEFAQEVSDYLILTDPAQGALDPGRALLFNFVSGISVLLGVVTILAQDQIDSTSLGCLLAFGGGVYVQIGATEAMPRAFASVKNSVQLRLLALCSFAVGACAIGLVLLDHEHCVAGGGGAHDGHGHK